MTKEELITLVKALQKKIEQNNMDQSLGLMNAVQSSNFVKKNSPNRGYFSDENNAKYKKVSIALINHALGTKDQIALDKAFSILHYSN